MLGSDSVINARVPRPALLVLGRYESARAIRSGTSTSRGDLDLAPKRRARSRQGNEPRLLHRRDGFAAKTAELPGPGPTWLFGLSVVKDRENKERMFAHYMKVRTAHGGL